MRKLIGSIVVMAVLVWCGSVMAIDDGGCWYTDEFGNDRNYAEDWGPGWTCEGRLTLDDLATIDANGSVILGGPLYDELATWH